MTSHVTSSPFDFLATKENQELSVEVKGSTGPLTAILLTKNEVHHQKTAFPNNMLVIVDSIELDRKKAKPKASGGDLRIIQPWQILDENLSPISYQFSLDGKH